MEDKKKYIILIILGGIGFCSVVFFGLFIGFFLFGFGWLFFIPSLILVALYWLLYSKVKKVSLNKWIKSSGRKTGYLQNAIKKKNKEELFTKVMQPVLYYTLIFIPILFLFFSSWWGRILFFWFFLPIYIGVLIALVREHRVRAKKKSTKNKRI